MPDCSSVYRVRSRVSACVALVGSRTPGYRAWYFASMSEKSSGGGAFSSSNAMPRRLRVSQLRRASTRRRTSTRSSRSTNRGRCAARNRRSAAASVPVLTARTSSGGYARTRAARSSIRRSAAGSSDGEDVATTTPSVDSPGRRWRSSSTAVTLGAFRGKSSSTSLVRFL